MAVYTQDKRIGQFDTPLGKDKLVLRRFDGTEGMNELFEFRIEAIATESQIDFDKIIGKNCTLTMRTIDGGEREFDGILTEVQLLGGNTEGLIYRLALRPWLWLLSKRIDTRIFHNQTAPEIISKVFSKGPASAFAKFEMSLTKTYPEMEYTVHYRESDMGFVCRLMEQHGITFHFRHEKGSHTLILGDSKSSYKPIPGNKRAYIPVEARHRRQEEHLFHWTPERRFTSGNVTLNDYDFKRPTASLISEKTGTAKYAHGNLEIYDYPGKFVQENDGKTYANVRLDMERAGDGHFLAAGDCVSCAPGHLMELDGHPQDDQNEQYLALRCIHSFVAEAYRSTRSGDNPSYHGNYEFARSDKPYAPPIVTEKPFVHGPHTATVIGEGEIDCDEHGRILVRYHWDRHEDKSMRVRVGQVWASQKWGGMYIPRVGMEVIVDHLEGDPDKPIIVGCVYNGDNKPPYDLPGSKNIAGWKSNSTPGGGGYNEFIMDDTKGNELVRMHAQYDLDSTVENDERRLVKNDRKTEVKHDETGKVGNNRKVRVDVNETLDVGQEILIEAGMKLTLKVGASTIVMDNMSITVTSPTVEVKASSMFKSQAGMISQHDGGASMVLQAGIIKIN